LEQENLELGVLGLKEFELGLDWKVQLGQEKGWVLAKWVQVQDFFPWASWRVSIAESL
jgi:hypothetical protein